MDLAKGGSVDADINRMYTSKEVPQTALGRLRKDRRGFSLIEMVVVCAIIAALAAIAVPTFIGSKKAGHDSRAQVTLRSALAAERTYYVDFQQYTTNAADLNQIEPQLNFATTEAEADGVMVAVSGTQTVVMSSTSALGSQFCIMNIAEDIGSPVNGEDEAGTYYATGPDVSSPPTSITTSQCGNSGYLRTSVGWN
ncbi:MAG TPA: prepilin-type N-terminal cleavage/methylation domain-containing protein [Actinomycetota bacterium]|nr:prepilin-type N-terminal cleavage/methylation domain-containing protein [Actinomycetota bacterium]